MLTQVDLEKFAKIFFDGDENEADYHIFEKRHAAHAQINLDNLDGHLNKLDKQLKVEFSEEINGQKYFYEEVYGLDRHFKEFYRAFVDNADKRTEKELKESLIKIFDGYYIDSGSYEEEILVDKELVKKNN